MHNRRMVSYKTPWIFAVLFGAFIGWATGDAELGFGVGLGWAIIAALQMYPRYKWNQQFKAAEYTSETSGFADTDLESQSDQHLAAGQRPANLNQRPKRQKF